MKLSFDPLHESDIPAIRWVFEDTDGFEGFNSEHIRAFLSEKHNIALIAKLDGAVIGLVYGYSLTRMDGTSPQFFIYSVDIHPDYQDKGYGGRFMQWVVDWARDNGFIESFVITDKGNPRACRVYEKAGMVRGMTGGEPDDNRVYEVHYKE